MSSVNKVVLIGNLGHSPDIKTFPNGGRVANFSLATSESWKDKATGERKTRTEWHRISVTNELLVGIVEKYVKKGSKLYIEGQLETRKYTGKDGTDKYTTEVVLRPYHGEIVLLDRKENTEEPAASAYNDPQAATSPGTLKTDAPQRNPMDDEIPF